MKRPFAAPALASALLLAAPGLVAVLAQNRASMSPAIPANRHVMLGLAVRKLNVSGTLLQAAAHPDDEHNALYALFTHGMGLRSIDVQLTRGDGGQNEIGPELFRDMAVLRTSELLAAHRLDGAEQYFTRAIDYGYSFDPDEVISKWGRKEIVGDLVRLIRTFRPDVVLTMNIQGRGGDRAHEATAVLAREAFRAAGDANAFPEQLAQGLRPWQAPKLYFTGGFGPGGGPGGGGRGGPGGAPPPAPAAQSAAKVAAVNSGAYDALLGRTYAEIGTAARAYHKCQGMGGLPPVPGMAGGRGGRGGSYQLMETIIPGQKDKDETSLFDGVDIALTGIARFAGANPPEALRSGLAAVAAQAQRAQQAFAAGNDDAAVEPVEAGLGAVRELRSRLGSMGLDDAARFEIDFRLEVKERDYQDAVAAAHGLTFDAVADDGLVTAGQSVRLSMVAMNHGPSEVAVTALSIAGFETPGSCTPGVARKDAAYTCSAEARVPSQAEPTTPYFTDVYWKKPSNPAIQIFAPDVPFGLPFRPTPFRVTFRVKTGGVEITREVPVEFRYQKDIYAGEKRMELNVVPAFSVKVTPTLGVIPAPAGARPSDAAAREVHVSVTNGTKGAAEASVSLEVPPGWRAEPAAAPLRFSNEDETLSARFRVIAPPGVKTGEYAVRAVVASPASPDRKFGSGYQEIEYPHVERRQVMKPAEVSLRVVDVKVVPGISVGYIAGVGDQVPPAIEQLGAKLDFIEPDELSWGDLSKYDVIVTGVRAYERRGDLRASNRRLLDYAERGGTVVVQYNKMEFNQAQYGPYPARVSGNRVTDEEAPVKVLVPDHPVFRYPNRIGQAAWGGWVQERGLYFLGEKDKRYADLVSMTDSFRDNPGEKLGSLVEAQTGKGRWLYVGLALWRQLPAGTEGAYQLLANLLALGKRP